MCNISIRRFLNLILLTLLLVPAQAAHAEPDYAQWGRIAVKAAAGQYPDAAITDYKHVGRTVLSDQLSREVFKLWLRQDRGEFGVYASVTFNHHSNAFISITWSQEAPAP